MSRAWEQFKNETEEISVAVRTVGDVGYCNGCNASRRHNQKVANIKLISISVRLCGRCAAILIRSLKKNYAALD